MAGIDVQLVRVRLLNALRCPSRVMHLETTVATLMANSETVAWGLDPLAEFLGYDNRRSVARLLDESAKWQRAANISLCTVQRGERNVRRLHQFSTSRLNAAAFFIVSEIESNPDYNSTTIEQIDRHTETAIQRFIRQPLTVAQKPAPQIKTKRKRRERAAAGGGAVNSWDIFGTLPESLKEYGLRFFPLDGRTPRIWNYRQNATSNPIHLSDWQRRYPGTNWAILTGKPLVGGGFLTVPDVDLHGEGEQFGNGFKTLALREAELGPLPETFTVGTPRDGQHLYFRSSIALPTWSGQLGPGLDCKGTGSGLVVAPCSAGYRVLKDLPIADLPKAWEDALNVLPKTARRVAVGKRNEYLLRVAYAMACQGKQVEQIEATLRERLRFNCEPGGREIGEAELRHLAVSACNKIKRAGETMDRITA